MDAQPEVERLHSRGRVHDSSFDDCQYCWFGGYEDMGRATAQRSDRQYSANNLAQGRRHRQARASRRVKSRRHHKLPQPLPSKLVSQSTSMPARSTVLDYRHETQE
ncbi:MAG: hypothetical protein AAB462_04590 [Patescibacteria group bacterium]